MLDSGRSDDCLVAFALINQFTPNQIRGMLACSIFLAAGVSAATDPIALNHRVVLGRSMGVDTAANLTTFEMEVALLRGIALNDHT
jgi:hypothetical protein